MSVQSSLAKHMGFAADSRKANAAEAGAAELMANLYRTYADPLTDQMLFDWHAMLMNGRRDLNEIVRYRTPTDPMQFVSAALYAPPVHYAALPSDRVLNDMQA